MRVIACGAACLVLMGCGGSSGQNGFVTEVTDTEISLSARDIDVALPRDLQRDQDALFAVAREALEDDSEQVLAVSESEATRAAILISHDDSTTADLFFDRKIAPQLPLTGRAKFEGAYYGTFAQSENATLRARLEGTAEFSVDFETMSVSGFISDRKLPLFGLVDADGAPLLFDVSTSLLLETADIRSDGRFDGKITVIDSTGGSEGNGSIIPNLGTYDGTFGGADASEIVGGVSVNSRGSEEEDRTTSGERGVFRAILEED